MSEMEMIKGKLTFLTTDVEEYCQNVCYEKHNIKEKSEFYTWSEILIENSKMYEYVVINGSLYSGDVEVLDPHGHTIVNVNDDKSIDFDIHFYNGGGCWGELIESGIK